ncbi:hypothetical protein FLJ40852 [Homo sapiens]|nr:hypothetical protein FLJ40852 [Homo sapiens]
MGKARMQSPTTTNYAVEFSTFGNITGVSTSGVQSMSPTLGKTTFVIMVSSLPGKAGELYFWPELLQKVSVRHQVGSCSDDIGPRGKKQKLHYWEKSSHSSQLQPSFSWWILEKPISFIFNFFYDSRGFTLHLVTNEYIT